MDIEGPVRELGEIEVTPLRDAILGLDEAVWGEHVRRQEEYEVHRQTQSVVLVFCDGWPEVTVQKEVGWDHLAKFAVPLMHALIERGYPKGGTIVRAMAARLAAKGRIAPHFDSHPSFRHTHRIHIPVTTNPLVRFMIDGRPQRMKVGEAYEINNQKTHSVMNSGRESRINFIFDYLPPG